MKLNTIAFTFFLPLSLACQPITNNNNSKLKTALSSQEVRSFINNCSDGEGDVFESVCRCVIQKFQLYGTYDNYVSISKELERLDSNAILEGRAELPAPLSDYVTQCIDKDPSDIVEFCKSKRDLGYKYTLNGSRELIVNGNKTSYVMQMVNEGYTLKNNRRVKKQYHVTTTDNRSIDIYSYKPNPVTGEVESYISHEKQKGKEPVITDLHCRIEALNVNW